jgi:hypothetical protein
MLELFGGPDRDRTDDLFHAMEARSGGYPDGITGGTGGIWYLLLECYQIHALKIKWSK